MMNRDALVAAARESIARGSHSFAAASRIFDEPTRERAWLLYAWCRAADDLTDGQDLGHAGAAPHDPMAAHTKLETLTAAALDGDEPVPTPFAALRQVVRETGMPRRFIDDHLAGFALDAQGWRPQETEDLLRYCYHVAGAVGCMMAVIMGVDPADEDTLDRACDLGIAFQLANIARDIVPDAQSGRCYLPAVWLSEAGLAEAEIGAPGSRPAVASIAARLVCQAAGYRASARVGAARLPARSRMAVLAADAIYGAIGEKVVASGERAWDQRTRIGGGQKLVLALGAVVRAGLKPPPAAREGLWTRPRQRD